MAQLANLKCRGLHTHPNPLGSVPEGALLEAINAVIDKEDILENRRGSKKYGDSLASVATKLFEYRDRILAYHGTTLSYDSDGAGTWADYSGTYTAPSGFKMRSVQSNQNFYFTTTTGIYKIDALTATPVSAGAPQGLDSVAALSVAGSGWFTPDNQVAYRIVWGIRDANENLILGAPSQRTTIANPALGTADTVDLDFTIPDGITTSHVYQVYRSALSGGAAIEPNDELQLAYEGNPTSAEITAKNVSLTDVTVDALLGSTLYTSPSQEGILLANRRPPIAKAITVFRDHVLYANTETNQSKEITMIAVGGTSLSVFQPTGDTNTSTTITNVSSFTGLAVGQKIEGTDIPAGTYITVLTPGSNELTLSQAATGSSVGVTLTCRDTITIDGDIFQAGTTAADGAGSEENIGNKQFQAFTAGTPADNIEDTSLSLIRVINRQTSGVDIYGYYLSGFEDLPGKLRFEDKVVGGASWAITSSKGSAFSPILPSSGTTVSSSNEAKGNRIYIAKDKEPEAVPLLQYLDAGSADKAIKRIIALRDSVFILKEDGIYRMTGTSVSDFDIALFDNTALLIGDETAVTLNNQVFAYTTQGVVAISDTGVQVISRPVEKDLLELSSDLYPNFESASFAVGYETERKYLLFTVSETTDTVATQVYVYNSFTNAWTTWTMVRSAAIINEADDKLYMAHGSTAEIRQERKTFTLTDYAEDQYTVTIVGAVGTTVEMASTSDAAVDQTLFQGTEVQAVVTEVTDATHVEVDRTVSWVAGSATLYDNISVSAKWAPAHGGAPGVLKHFPEATVFFQEAEFQSIDILFTSNFATAETTVTLTPTVGNRFGDGAFGDGSFGGDTVPIQPVRTYVPLEMQRAHWLTVKLNHKEALTKFGLAGIALVMEPMETRSH